MEEVLDFLTENPLFYLATVEDGQPRIRPFGFAMELESKLYFITNNTKSVYHQLIENPYLEVCVSSSDNKWIRLRGKAVFDDNMVAKIKAFTTLPYLKVLYGSPNNPIVQSFYIEDGEASFNSIEDGEYSRVKL